MKMSDALKDHRDLEVPFGSERLRITYRPMAWTVAEMEEITASKDIGRIVDLIRQTVVQWDLTDDHNMLVPLGKPQRQPVVIDQDHPEGTIPATVVSDPLRDVPIHIFTTILRAIREDNGPSGEA